MTRLRAWHENTLRTSATTAAEADALRSALMALKEERSQEVASLRAAAARAAADAAASLSLERANWGVEATAAQGRAGPGLCRPG